MYSVYCCRVSFPEPSTLASLKASVSVTSAVVPAVATLPSLLRLRQPALRQRCFGASIYFQNLPPSQAQQKMLQPP